MAVPISSMLTSLQYVAISDFILAGMCLFMAGVLFGRVKSHESRYAMLSYFMLFTGLSAFIGGLDHGFFEPLNERYYPRVLTYSTVAAATFCLFRYTAMSYFSGWIRRILILIAFAQLIGFVISAVFVDDFTLVIANYSPVMLLFFIMNLLHVKRSRSEPMFVYSCVIMMAATAIQVLDVGITSSINGDTLFHILAVVAYLFFFKGARNVPAQEQVTR